MWAVVGLHKQSEYGPNTQRIQVVEQIAHPGYPGANGIANDIALLRLAEPITFDYATTHYACMPQAGEEPPVGNTCYVAGWGTLESGGNSPDELNSVNVELYDDSVCANDQSYGPNKFLGDLEICAGKFEGGKDSCQGDSGGPMVCIENGEPVLTGVVSWGYGCADQGFPGVYAEVSEYIPWIDSIVLGTSTTTPASTPSVSTTTSEETDGSCPECLIPQGYLKKS